MAERGASGAPPQGAGADAPPQATRADAPLQATHTDAPLQAVRADARAPVDVAVGVLIDAGGRFLLSSRPPGKVYAGAWEFPGGKIEPGETVEQALRRELHEELGIELGAVAPWRTTSFDYPHAFVRLHFCKVAEWRGAFEMREGQRMAWQSLPVTVAPVLPGTVPVLGWLAEERGYGGPTHLGPVASGASTGASPGASAGAPAGA
ncbi:MAG: NUDIX domain-containing protein [Burkholderiales bacterium]|nr:NUDIX domain-containing protein [Burkholderiales bacterium]